MVHPSSWQLRVGEGGAIKLTTIEGPVPERSCMAKSPMKLGLALKVSTRWTKPSTSSISPNPWSLEALTGVNVMTGVTSGAT